MNTNFNYSGFVELFLESDDEFEPYGVSSEGLELLEPQPCSESTEKHLHSKAVLRMLD